MSSPSKPRQVPAKDLFCKIIGEKEYHVKYRDIASYLESSDYVRETKVEWILYPRDRSRKSLFHEMCTMQSPKYIIRLVVPILGGQYLSSKLCTDLLSTIGFRPYSSNNIAHLFRKILKRLSDFPEVKLQLLERAIMNKASNPAMEELFNYIKSIPLKLYNIEILHDQNETSSLKMLESSLTGKPPFEQAGEKVREFHQCTILEIAIHNRLIFSVLRLIERGKKELIMLSKRSLLEGVISEYDTSDSYDILKRLIDYGGCDLVLIERRWRNCDNEKMNIFQFLSENKKQLEKKWHISRIAKIMNMLLDTGGNDLVMKRNEKGQSILHTFAYFPFAECLPNIKRIINLGRENLLKMQDDKGNTILHQLSKQCSVSIECWEILAFNKEINLIRNNDGKTALDLAYENKTQNCIDKLGEDYDNTQAGERDLRVQQDTRGNSIHLEVGGKDLSPSIINEGESPSSTSHFFQNPESQADSEKNKSRQSLQAENENNDVLNDTIKESQKEKESERMNDMTMADINNQLKDEIKHLQDIHQSLQSKIQEQQVVIENLQGERKQADLEFEIVKTLHEENKNAYEQSLVEVKKLKKVERSQQDDICDQKEMIQNLQYELGKKDEEYTLRLHKLETENQRLRDFHDKEEVPYTDKPSSLQEEGQRLIEEVKANIDEVSTIENRVHTLEEENNTLKDVVKKQKQILTEKQHENKALKDENERLIDKIATSSLKRSRGVETEEIDCIEEDEDDIFCPPSKRGKHTPISSETRSTESTRNKVASLESENEELINELENEKASHMKTLRRLKEARKYSKKN